MDKKEVSRLIKEAGFHSKAEFAKKMGLSATMISLWGEKCPLPPYFHQVLEWASKAKKYDELIKDLKS